MSASTAYDAVPYESFPYAHTHPDHVGAVARLFGLNAAPPSQCRVLEIGCAAGGNIIPLAASFPDIQVTGVDPSRVQVAEGEKRIAALGLTNARLHAVGAESVDSSFGEFDYIICHGVFSWVPASVQDTILKVCAQRLAPDGVALISYNTLPGWNMVASLREMMLYHTRRFTEPGEKAVQARALLHFVEDAAAGNPIADVVKKELQQLAGMSDWYLLHDHLEETNQPLYLYQFAERAAQAGLAYLGDTSLVTMYTGNLPPAVAETLLSAGDIVRIEQYMDFICNRRFRNTLLCRSDRGLNRSLDAADVEKFHVRSLLAPTSAVDLNQDGDIVFSGAATGLTTHTRAAAALYSILHEQGRRAIAPQALYTLTRERLADHGLEVSEAEIRAQFLENAMKLVFAGGLQLSLGAQAPVTHQVSDRPRATRQARVQAQEKNWVVSQFLQKVDLTDVHRLLLTELDGTRGHTEIIDAMLVHFQSGALSMNRDGTPITDMGEVRSHLDQSLTGLLTDLARTGLLEA